MNAQLDPLTFAVIAGDLESTLREMTTTMAKTGRSPVLSEAHDFSNALFDSRSRMIIQGDNFPVHVGAMIDAGKTVASYFRGEVYPGDVLYCNDPAYEGSHLPDMTMYKPVFHEERLVFWAANKSHMMDTGGPVAGGYNPGAHDIYAEGLRISPVKLWERGRERLDVLDLLLANVRNPRTLRGDIRAQLAAVTRAELRLVALIERYGVEAVVRCCDELLDRAERIMRRQVAKMPNGTYEGSGVIEDYGHGRGETVIRARLSIEGSELEVALSAPTQSTTYFNSYSGNTKSMIYYAILASIDADIPHNEGLYRPIHIDLGPLGTCVNARMPAACAQATGSVADAIWESVTGALTDAIPEHARAGWARPYTAIVSGTDARSGELWADLFLAGFMGGGGASWGVDGWDAIGHSAAGGALRFGSVELLEYKLPVFVHRHELRIDSACAGRWRGGLGTAFEMELVGDASMTAVADGVQRPPPSRLGGASREVGEKVHAKWIIYPNGESREVCPQTVYLLPAATRLVSYTAGGGSVGHPFERDPAAVRADVVAGIVTFAAAEDEYGVVLDRATLVVDEDATVALRG